jgi:hypothetical protein
LNRLVVGFEISNQPSKLNLKSSPTVGFFLSRSSASFRRRCACISLTPASHLRIVAPFRICSTAQLFRVAALVRRFSVAALAAFRVTFVLSRRKA